MLTETLPSWYCDILTSIANSGRETGQRERLMGLWRGPRHSGCATPWQPPAAGPSHLHARMGHAAHCEYQGTAAPGPHGGFGLPKEKFWFECDRKLVALHQTILEKNNTISLMWRIYALMFTGYGMTSLKNLSNALYTSAIAVPEMYWLPEQTSSDTDVSFFSLKQISALNGAMNLLGLLLDFPYVLNLGLKASHVINVRPNAIIFTRNTRNNLL